MRGNATLPLIAAFALSACATTNGAMPPATIAASNLSTATGTLVGTMSITADNTGNLALTLSLSGLPSGIHGMHLHAVGQCQGPAFTSAGGHLNPHGRQHGANNPAGRHLGDLPNITVAADGTASTTIALDATHAELDAGLFDADGAAVVVHAAADDYVTDPTGNSGARIACGVLVRP